MSVWEAAKDKQDFNKLLTMIRNIFHRQNDTKQGTIAFVELDITLYMTFHNTTKSLSCFLATFRAQIEAIKAHGGRSGYHPKLMQVHLDKICE